MLREEPLKLLQSPLQVKDLFGQVGDDLFEAPAVAGFQRRIAKPRFGRLELSLENLQVDCTLWARGIFATLKQRFRLFASLLKLLSPETAPRVFGQLERIVRHSFQVEPRDSDLLLRTKVGNKSDPRRGIFESKRGVQDFLKQPPPSLSASYARGGCDLNPRESPGALRRGDRVDAIPHQVARALLEDSAGAVEVAETAGLRWARMLFRRCQAGRKFCSWLLRV